MSALVIHKHGTSDGCLRNVQVYGLSLLAPSDSTLRVNMVPNAYMYIVQDAGRRLKEKMSCLS